MTIDVIRKEDGVLVAIYHGASLQSISKILQEYKTGEFKFIPRKPNKPKEAK